MFQNITVTISDHVARVCLNRPEKHNAFNEVTIADLTKAFHQLAADDSVRVVVLESTGRSFSAGGDLAWMKKMVNYSEAENHEDSRRLAQMLKLLNELPKPTIGRVQGAAYGGGVGLVACCDIVVAAEDANFCLSEVRLGLSPATISPYVIHAMGVNHARRYFLTAEKFTAKDAEKIGLVHEVCKMKELDQQVDRFIGYLMAGGPEALAVCKNLIYITEPMVNDEIFDRTAQQIARQRTEAEGQEGLSSFFEKRKAKWIDESVTH